MYSSSESILPGGVLALVNGVTGEAASPLWAVLVCRLVRGSSSVSSVAFLFRVAEGVVRDGMKPCA